MNLQQYDRMKSVLAELLRSAAGDSTQTDVRELFGRLAEDRFNIVVVGRFSRGKTTLMNAMLGTDRLPTGIVPVTSVITTVTYGSEEQVVLYYQHTNLFMDIPISQLREHITEQGNPGNYKRVRVAEVQLPAELLRRGFHFVDTPGLGSSIENTRTTEAFLPEADAFVLVTSFDGALTQEEERILNSVHASGRRIFLVVNKQDAVAVEQRRQVLDHLSSRLQAIFGASPAPVFSTSAEQGLAARLRGDADRLEQSGLPALEAALVQFLLTEKRREFLRTMIDRISEVVAREYGAEEAMAQLAALRAELLSAPEGTAPDAGALPPRASISSSLPACEICARVDRSLFDYLAKLQYRLSRDPDLQADLANRHGLCGPHTWQFERMAAPREVCTGLALLAERQATRLRSLAAEGMEEIASKAAHAMLPTVRSCAACLVGADSAARAAAAAASRLERDPAGALDKLSAICLPHLPLLLRRLRDPTLTRSVLRRQADLLDRVAEDMRHFALKRDGLKRHLTTKEETTAAARAVSALAGDPRSQLGPERAAVLLTAVPADPVGS